MRNDPTGIVATCETREQETWIHLEGELDHEGCEQVAPVLLRAKGAGPVVVDMSGVTFVASQGIGLMLQTYRTLQKEGRTLLLRGLRPHIRRSFEIVGVFTVVPEWGDELLHDDAELLISKVWDGAVTAIEAERLSVHLQHCSDCARNAEEMSRLLPRINQCLKREREERGPS